MSGWWAECGTIKAYFCNLICALLGHRATEISTPYHSNIILNLGYEY
jgi:hypothetical protein